MTTPTNQLYTPSSAAEIRDDFLTDVRLEARKYASEDEVDRVTRPGTDWFILATALGNLGLLQYSNIARADANANVLTATGSSLDQFRQVLGLPAVIASPSTGSIVVTVQPAGFLANFDSNQFVLPNGKRGKINGVFVGVADQTDLPVTTIDTGSDCNLAAGNVVRFVSPPPNVKTEAKVSVNAPLSGAVDNETDVRKRDRILNRLQTVPAGGNWGYAIEQSLNALATVQYAFVYPALGGPASEKVVVVRDIDPDSYVFSRSLSTQATSIVRDALHATMPDDIEIVVASVVEQGTDVTMSMTLPVAASAGGNGLGWLDAAPWPPLAGGQTRVTITALSADGLTVTLDAATATAPLVNQHIAWWSKVDQQFYTRTIAQVITVVPGAYVIAVDQPLVDHNNTLASVGEYISPTSTNIVAYGDTWRGSMRRLGPGENTADPNRIPRALRRPFIADEWPSALTVRQLVEMLDAHAEISDAAWTYRSLTAPSVPGAVTTSPNILVPANFGVYKQ